MPGAIYAEGLRKTFGDVTTLDGMALSVPPGSVLGLLGPNGSGKTTTVRILSTLISADSGTAMVAGHNVFADPQKVRLNIGLSGQYAALDELLTGRENLQLVAELYGMRTRHAKMRAHELLEWFGLQEAADRPSKTYSGGMRRRLDLAAALVGNPPVMFMDEPTTGLDPYNRLLLWEAVEALVANGTTLLLTTQYLEEADRLANDISVIDHGKVIAQGTPNDLKRLAGHERIELIVRSIEQLDWTVEFLSRFATGEATVDRSAHQITLPISGGSKVLGTIINELDERNIAVDDIGLRRPTLDEVFLYLTGEDARQARREATVHGTGPAAADIREAETTLQLKLTHITQTTNRV
ncbi:ATP-binding cassette domain-containing protein [Streptomyces armeniacus]|uniref:ATP-binding cassette domain-containing protein n=1 Tax=Streptomyces armeniacus TaxID=83291 RepID=A0A345XQ05_9ACTN|nr:ATP-binding cassette domain-containing protein [Streptomyces armeniacus]AXK33721.1 ATP-binding cassette domain-containing protein [Streptomyces armeniacus]QIQ28642.1 Nbc46 [Streptomyces sp.]